MWDMSREFTLPCLQDGYRRGSSSKKRKGSEGQKIRLCLLAGKQGWSRPVPAPSGEGDAGRNGRPSDLRVARQKERPGPPVLCAQDLETAAIRHCPAHFHPF